MGTARASRWSRMCVMGSWSAWAERRPSPRGLIDIVVRHPQSSRATRKAIVRTPMGNGSHA